MNWIKSSIVLQLLFAYVFTVSGILCNLIQLISYILIWPFDKVLYRKINYYIQYALMSNMSGLIQYWSGTEVEMYLENEDEFKYLGKEHCISVLNHKFDADWLVGMVAVQNLGLLGGSRALFKESVKYVPIMGWLWYLAEHIFLKRNWEADSRRISMHFRSIFDYPKDHFINVIIFCEGTRFTEEKHKASLEYARQKGLPELKHHLLPRTKGFCLLAKECASHVDYIYDITIGIHKMPNGKEPTLNMILDGEKVTAKMFLKRRPMTSIPYDDDKKCSEFVFQMYKEKDMIYDCFERTGNFIECGGKKVQQSYNYYDLYIWIGWLVCILTPSAYYFFKFLVYGSVYTKIIFAVLTALVFIIMKMLVRYTNHRSSFGVQKSTQKKTE